MSRCLQSRKLFDAVHFRADFLSAVKILIATERINAAEIMALLLHIGEGVTLRAIADVFDCSSVTVYRMIEKTCSEIVESGLLEGYDV